MTRDIFSLRNIIYQVALLPCNVPMKKANLFIHIFIVGVLEGDNDLSVKGNICFEKCLNKKCVMLETNICSGECHRTCDECLYPEDPSYCTHCAADNEFVANPHYGACILSPAHCDKTYGFEFIFIFI